MVRLVASDGSPRWLPRAEADLRDALDALRSVEVLRAAEVEGIVQGTRKVQRSSLEALTKLAPAPWPLVFADHRDALRLLVTEIETETARTKQLLQTAAHRRPKPSAAASADADAAEAAAAHRSMLATLDTVPQLSLREFLG